jgi:hypothetical protein
MPAASMLAKQGRKKVCNDRSELRLFRSMAAQEWARRSPWGTATLPRLLKILLTH